MSSKYGDIADPNFVLADRATPAELAAAADLLAATGKDLVFRACARFFPSPQTVVTYDDAALFLVRKGWDAALVRSIGV